MAIIGCGWSSSDWWIFGVDWWAFGFWAIWALVMLGVEWADVYGLLGKNGGGGGWGIKYGKKKWSGEKKWWTSKSHWERQNKKVGIHVQLLDLLWIKKNKKYWSCICTKKKKNFFWEKKVFRSSCLYFDPFKSQKFK